MKIDYSCEIKSDRDFDILYNLARHLPSWNGKIMRVSFGEVQYTSTFVLLHNNYWMVTDRGVTYIPITIPEMIAELGKKLYPEN